MKIYQLIDNDEFTVSADFIIYEYIPPEDSTEEGDIIEKYDSTKGGDIPRDLLTKDITNIAVTGKGIMEIEYIEWCTPI